MTTVLVDQGGQCLYNSRKPSKLSVSYLRSHTGCKVYTKNTANSIRLGGQSGLGYYGTIKLVNGSPQIVM